jgi:hypothetical protein
LMHCSPQLFNRLMLRPLKRLTQKTQPIKQIVMAKTENPANS